MPRHSAPKSARPTLLRAGLTVAAAAAAIGTGGAAHAAPGGVDVVSQDAQATGQTPVQARGVTGVVTNSVNGVGEVKRLQLNPLAKTGVDPLDNHVGTQVADFKSVGTQDATGPLSAGAALQDLPLAGPATRALPM
ncbi:hypothetical protein [Streptomyces sp. NPDC000410]|uniref:hypothetical protein n=1 Tax=Streptomyces sp. NPDC000410 TaxID=3154254 RepID=UPI00332C1331